MSFVKSSAHATSRGLLFGASLLVSLGCSQKQAGEGDATSGEGEDATSADSETGSSDTGGTGGEGEQPGQDTNVVAFDAEHIYFGDENRRQVDLPVTFPPADQMFESVTLNFGLGCPNNNCDDWDRYGTLGIVENPGTEEERFIEVQRFITPYGIGGEWSVDMTMLQPILAGDVTMRVFIDTWVGPGHAQGDGWLFSANFDFVGGTPSPIPDAVIPIWYQSFNAGHPEMAIDAQVLAQEVAVPGTPKNAALRSFITGHGFGNSDNCAEFCPLDHTFSLNGNDHSTLVWRDNCAVTGVLGQQGTWQYSRAGWCPGADVYPILDDVTTEATSSETLMVQYGLEEYENSCRADAVVCTGCVAGATCDDGHGQPYYYLSSMLVTFR